MRQHVRAAVQIALLGGLLAACSFLGFRPPPTAPQQPPSPTSSTAGATAEVATAEIGTIYPETFDPNATPTPVPPATPSPTAQPRGISQLIFALTDELGPPDWCDPDFYPVPRAEEIDLAREHLEEMQADASLYESILARNGIDPRATLTDHQLLTVYRDWKVLTKAIVLTPATDGYTFDYVALRGPVAEQTDFHVAGTISADGQITTNVNEPASAPNCPICLARGTLIDTPDGPIAVEKIRVGIMVWTQDELGERHAGVVFRVGTTPVPASHRVVDLVLADGRTLDVSPGHPLPDGRLIGQLREGDEIDGSIVRSAELVTYAGGATFDLLSLGGTGVYWANGILVGSTLAPIETDTNPGGPGASRSTQAAEAGASGLRRQPSRVGPTTARPRRGCSARR